MPTIEELQEQILQLQDKVKDYEQKQSLLEKDNADLKEKNSSLTDYNAKLFARISQDDAPDEKPRVLTAEEKEQEIVDEIVNLVTKGDK